MSKQDLLLFLTLVFFLSELVFQEGPDQGDGQSGSVYAQEFVGLCSGYEPPLDSQSRVSHLLPALVADLFVPVPVLSLLYVSANLVPSGLKAVSWILLEF